MGIDVADTASEEICAIDEIVNLGRLGHRRSVQRKQLRFDLRAIAEIAEQDFPYHIRMDDNHLTIEKRRKMRIGGVKLINPDRGIDNDHRVSASTIPG